MERPKMTRVKGKLMLLHRHIMEKFLGNALLPTEIVHHKDGNNLNNNIDNLEICSRKEHFNEHLKRAGGKYKNFGFKQGHFPHNKLMFADDNLSWCSKCSKILTKDKFYKLKSRWNGVQKTCKDCQRKMKEVK